MFLDKYQKSNKPELHGYSSMTENQEVSYNKIIFYVILFVVILIGTGSYFLYKKITEKKAPVVVQQEEGNGATTTGKLPEELGGNEQGGDQGTSTKELKAEDITFGLFYKKPSQEDIQTKTYDLPLNVKTDVDNYRDVARKINLDTYVDSFNKYGFSIIDNQFPENAYDFFSGYNALISKDIPIVLTSDFLLYYYQNTLKKVYKDIEQNAFYENLWDIEKKFYDISLTRYKKRLDEVGQINDPILEGARLELVYHTVALRLLMPSQNQINYDVNFSDASKFKPQEGDYFSFIMPEYLYEDVEREIALIKSASEVRKSQVFLYERDYKTFAVPNEYKSNAKLNNFYLASRWLNSIFPLYYKNNDCEKCLIDKDDWGINMIAASYITKDFYDNQDIKNQWAIIYKFISFFSGLKQDLTYLHYQGALTSLFGDKYVIEDIFSKDNPKRDENLSNLQKKLADFKFTEIEGAVDREMMENRPFLGMRTLQESFWPNNFIFNQLTGEDLQKNMKDTKTQYFTSCRFKATSNFYRCRGFGMDIVNLFHPETKEITSKYFLDNTDYVGYQDRINGIKNLFSNFNQNTWNNNIYWLTLDLSDLLLRYNKDSQPIFTRSSEWRNQKDTQTVLGGWINLHLPADNIISVYQETGRQLGGGYTDNENGYVEPNISFIKDLIARNDMLLEILATLKVSDKVNSASLELKDFNIKLNKILEISKKELAGTALDSEDYKLINSLVNNYSVENKLDKSYNFTFKGGRSLVGSINGIKFVGLIYQKDGKKNIAIGPVFNYGEK